MSDPQQPPMHDFEEAVIDWIVDPHSMKDRTALARMSAVVKGDEPPMGQDWLVKAIEAVLDWSEPMTDTRKTMLDKAFLFGYGPERAQSTEWTA